MKSPKIFVAACPFGICNSKSLDTLQKTGWEILLNPLGRELKEDEVRDMLEGINGVIAGSELYTSATIERANDLKVICRVGIGLDNVDLNVCRGLNIQVTYTPDSPSDGVADLTVGQIINLLRGVHISDRHMRSKKWLVNVGKLVSEVKIGVLGVGRIGSRVIKRLQAFGANPIYACDISPVKLRDEPGIIWVDKKKLFQTCDIITIHIPMNRDNYHCVGGQELLSMQAGSFLVNTSRGKIVCEKTLTKLLRSDYLGGAALDVFEEEPYCGPLTECENVILTAHMGSLTSYGRFKMECEAVEDCIRVLQEKEPLRPVEERNVVKWEKS